MSNVIDRIVDHIAARGIKAHGRGDKLAQRLQLLLGPGGHGLGAVRGTVIRIIDQHWLTVIRRIAPGSRTTSRLVSDMSKLVVVRVSLSSLGALPPLPHRRQAGSSPP